jgi:hypothetical protein
MPKTYTPIATTTISGSSTSNFTFSSISGSYTDLVLIGQIAETPSLGSLVYRVNSDSGSNYSTTYLDGNGSSATSGRYTSQTEARATYEGVGTGFGTYIFNFQNYSNTTTYKTILGRASNAGNSAEATVSLWRSTSAITSITIYAGQNFASGSTFTLYGVKSA